MNRTELPNAYFNSKGQLPGYLGLRQLDGAINADFPGADSLGSVIWLAANQDDCPGISIPDTFDASQSQNSDLADWLGGQLKAYLTTTPSDDIAGNISNLISLSQKSNRDFLLALLKNAIVKTTTTSKGVILAMTIQAAHATAPYAMFADNPLSLACIRLYDWSKTLTPAQEAAYAQNAANIKSDTMDIPILDVLMVNAVDVTQGFLEHENPADVISNMAIDTTNAVIDSFLVFLSWALLDWLKLIPAVIKSNIVLSWLGKTLLGALWMKTLSYIEKKSDLQATISQSGLLQQANQFMSDLNNPDQINWTQLYGQSQAAAMNQEGTMAAMNAIGE